MATFTLTRSSQFLLVPCAPTPAGDLHLSFIDKALGLRNITELLQVFSHGTEPAKAIQVALAGALIPYYPVAGRVLESGKDGLRVACTGQGVWFSEATADCSLEDVNYLAQPLRIPPEQLLPVLPAENDHQEVILTMQVTEFTCGGFAVCFGFNHAVFDGFGIMQFFRAVGEIARGLERPMIEPIWCRELIPGPPPVTQAHPSHFTIADLHLQWITLNVSASRIVDLKNDCTKETGRPCSEFDVFVAILWQSRTRAINPAPSTEVHLSCPANSRALLQDVLPSKDGYYGNCTFHAIVSASASMVVQAPIGELVQLILEARERIPGEFLRWMRGELKEKSIASFCNYETVVISDIGKLGCGEIDYGWGEPIQTGMVRSSDYMASGVIDSSPADKHEFRITGRFVREEHSSAFLDEMNKQAV